MFDPQFEHEIRQRDFAERFGAALETWRFHVNSYWTRTNYFAILQVAAFSSLWNVVTARHHLYTAVFLCLAASIFCLIWFVTGVRMFDYVDYWWRRAAAMEKEFDISPERSLVLHQNRADLRQRRSFGSHTSWIKAIPCVFLSAWLWMLVWAILELLGH